MTDIYSYSSEQKQNNISCLFRILIQIIESICLCTYRVLSFCTALELLVTSTDGADGNTDSTGAVVDLFTAFNARHYGFEGRPNACTSASASGSDSITSSNSTSSTPGTAAQQLPVGHSAAAAQATDSQGTSSSSGGQRRVLFQLSGSSDTTPAESDAVFAGVC